MSVDNVVSVEVWNADGQTVRRLPSGLPSVVLVCRSAEGVDLGHISLEIDRLRASEPDGFFAVSGRVVYGDERYDA